LESEAPKHALRCIVDHGRKRPGLVHAPPSGRAETHQISLYLLVDGLEIPIAQSSKLKTQLGMLEFFAVSVLGESLYKQSFKKKRCKTKDNKKG